MVLQEGFYIASQISSVADFETMDTYEARIAYYQENNYSYIPIPSARKYYDVEVDKLYSISEDQFIREGEPLINVVRKMVDQPFLLWSWIPFMKFVIEDGKLVRQHSGLEPFQSKQKQIKDHPKENIYTYNELKEGFPDLVNELKLEEEWNIITLADVNRRSTKAMLYPLFAGLANQLSERIERKYPDSEDLFDPLRAATIGNWIVAQKEGLNIHIAEFMTLSDIIKVLKNSDKEFVVECGFSSNNDIKRKIGGVVELRHKVMHANRTLVHNRDDLRKLLERVDRGLGVLEELEG